MTDIKMHQEMPSVDWLNEKFSCLKIEERINLLYEIFNEEDVLFTSSFGGGSALLLYFISKLKPSQKIFFIDTGFHFPETLAYKEQLTKMLGLQVTVMGPSSDINKLTERKQLWKYYPDTCCFLNKVMVMESLKASHKVWVSELMGHQTEHRSKLRFFWAE